ncbi:hypothetical protein IAU60_001210 [Kwoniella sp. DSM 27419]
MFLLPAVVLFAAGACARAAQVPWAVTQRSPHDTFVQHCKCTQIGSIYSNSTVVVTQDRSFDIVRFAAGTDGVLIRQLDDIEAIKRVGFIKPRRRQGHSEVAEKVVFGGWDVAWKEHEFKVVVATVSRRNVLANDQWAEGFSQVTQWHIITDQPDAARGLIQACAEYCSTYVGVIWVFEQGYWRPDRDLWEAVQQPPGNGKTISLKAIVKELGLPALYVKSFHKAPCVLVMEDLDSLINDQNRSFFLNEVDGLENNDGLLLEKLADVPEIAFPDTLLDEFAEKTGNFSVSSLLIIATRETDDLADMTKGDFRTVLLGQIAHLREELGAGITGGTGGSVGSFGGSGGRGFGEEMFAEQAMAEFHPGSIFQYTGQDPR